MSRGSWHSVVGDDLSVVHLEVRRNDLNEPVLDPL